MTVLALFSWWYTTGWAELARRVAGRAETMLQTFSVGLLAKTLFAPFKQIDAGGKTGGPLEVRMRAFGDLLFSRVFGAVLRTIFILVGLISALLAGVLGLVQLLAWPIVPLLPIIGLVLAIARWTI